MRLLLTSSGISNASIHNALVDLLGKPIAESSALIIPTAAYGFRQGPGIAWRLISGKAKSPLCELGWKSLGVLELDRAPQHQRRRLGPRGPGDRRPAGRRRRCRVSEPLDATVRTGRPLRALRREVLYVGMSAGSMAASSTFGETYR